ncbi:MerR family transcriptional regulator [Hyphomicrobium sulfonivorans]|nr:MerR family transcriptional regulator [Hyphomicrobium sulfonivorans]
MTDHIHTIGEVAKMSGIPVRRLRFYSDTGLLPPTARTASGYRMYSEADLAKLDLIVAMRQAGISLAEIGRTVAKDLSLTEVLSLRLQAIEAEISAAQRTAEALRSVLKLNNPTPQDLRELWTVTHQSQQHFRSTIRSFLTSVTEEPTSRALCVSRSLR